MVTCRQAFAVGCVVWVIRLFLELNFRCIPTKQNVWEMKADVITQGICSCLIFDSKEMVAFYPIEPLWHIDWASSVCMHPRVSFGPVDISLAQMAKSLPPAPAEFSVPTSCWNALWDIPAPGLVAWPSVRPITSLSFTLLCWWENRNKMAVGDLHHCLFSDGNWQHAAGCQYFAALLLLNQKCDYYSVFCVKLQNQKARETCLQDVLNSPLR